jgi:hypothetical protein
VADGAGVMRGLQWLAVGLVGAFGLFLMLAPEAGLALFGWVAFGRLPPIEELPSVAHPYLMFMHGVLGAVMFGWAVLMGLTLGRHPVGGARLILLSVGAWFLVDTAWSLACGFPGNALLNLGFLLIFLVAFAPAALRAGDKRG